MLVFGVEGTVEKVHACLQCGAGLRKRLLRRSLGTRLGFAGTGPISGGNGNSYRSFTVPFQARAQCVHQYRSRPTRLSREGESIRVGQHRAPSPCRCWPPCRVHSSVEMPSACPFRAANRDCGERGVVVFPCAGLWGRLLHQLLLFWPLLCASKEVGRAGVHGLYSEAARR
ncbi:hypothetical protein D9M71_473410 [compost metagenome]